jgi:XTP/dITP diphosphohydrolase
MILILASHNPNKKKEIEKVLPKTYQIKDLNDLKITDNIVEYGKTLEENALIKARYLYELLKENCIAEDSGLEINSLLGEPGVLSARYAGEERNDQKNIQLVLQKMHNKSNRSARFRTVIALVLNEQEYLFEGIVEGKIDLVPKGHTGFGYDPIFIPENYTQSFAELGEDLKVSLSHRTRAIQKLIHFLESQK